MVKVPQPVVREKSPGFVPVKVTLLKITVFPAPEVLVMVTFCEGLDEPTVKEEKVSADGAADTVIAAPTTTEASFDLALS
jgi:hypothetical protein